MRSIHCSRPSPSAEADYTATLQPPPAIVEPRKHIQANMDVVPVHPFPWRRRNPDLVAADLFDVRHGDALSSASGGRSFSRTKATSSSTSGSRALSGEPSTAR
ncbi:hypothetical protein ZWY2020_047719 [Hordeum vulgare]|nr:hypothetical protein ZWY2020_047719 [Hordeum vulgare]